MDRISTATKHVDAFGVGKHGFRDGNLGLGQAPTDLDAGWFNRVQEALMRVIEFVGLAGDAADYTLFRKAVDMMIRWRAGSKCVAGGTVDAITGAFSPAVTVLHDGMEVDVKASGANTLVNPTFKADGTAVKTIVKEGNQALLPGDIAGASHWVKLKYDATLDRYVLLNPAGKLGTGYFVARDEKASGSSGGTSVANGDQTRTLNTLAANTIPGASLSANQITLPAGTYRVNASAPAFVNSQAFLFNVTDGTVTVLGTSENAGDAAAGDPAITRSFVQGRFTIAAQKVFELRQYTFQARASNGLGFASGSARVEVYSTIEFIKE